MTQTTLVNSRLNTNKPVMVESKRFTKKDKAKELYVQYSDLSRDEIIQKFIEELDMQENSARTYVSTCAKELNLQLGKPYKTRNVNKDNLKREKALRIYADSVKEGMLRKEIIVRLASELNMTLNSAATHCSIAAKVYNTGLR